VRHCAVTASRKTRYRQRSAAGKIGFTVEIDGAVISWLEELHWLTRRESHGRAEIGDAIRRLLHDAAEEK
jgi:hypothetical protein